MCTGRVIRLSLHVQCNATCPVNMIIRVLKTHSSKNNDMQYNYVKIFLFSKKKLTKAEFWTYIKYENAISVWKTIEIEYKRLILSYKKSDEKWNCVPRSHLHQSSVYILLLLFFFTCYSVPSPRNRKSQYLCTYFSALISINSRSLLKELNSRIYIMLPTKLAIIITTVCFLLFYSLY